MQTKHITLSVVLAFGAVFAAQAEALAQHPAVLVQQKTQALDANTFIVGHPAGGASVHAHAGHEHPAVLAKRQSVNGHIDANAFRVQPPAATTWALRSEPELLVAKK